jgi:hypothetical protein
MHLHRTYGNGAAQIKKLTDTDTLMMYLQPHIR